MSPLELLTTTQVPFLCQGPPVSQITDDVDMIHASDKSWWCPHIIQSHTRYMILYGTQ